MGIKMENCCMDGREEVTQENFKYVMEKQELMYE